MELLGFLVDQDPLAQQEIEVILDHRDLMERRERLETRGFLAQKVYQAIKETLVLPVWWELMDHQVLRYEKHCYIIC